MPERIIDTRKMTVEESDTTFEKLARAQIRIWRRNGVVEDRIAKIKSILAEENAEDQKLIDWAKGIIGQFVLAFRDLFQKPRKRKTNWGRYGLETESELQIDNEESLIQRLLDRGYDDCFKVTRTILKSKVVARIEAGETFPGCRVLKGDVVKFSVDSSLTDQVEVTEQGKSAAA